jgi:hypothetical protein
MRRRQQVRIFLNEAAYFGSRKKSGCRCRAFRQSGLSESRLRNVGEAARIGFIPGFRRSEGASHHPAVTPGMRNALRNSVDQCSRSFKRAQCPIGRRQDAGLRCKLAMI